MSTELKTRLAQINKQFAALAQVQPAAMSAFQGLMKAATQEGSLPASVKELVAVALAVQKGCDDCVLFHTAQALRHGAARGQLAEVLALNIEMGGGPGAMYASKALAYFDALNG
ncbi:carboxymuconolactone decarboxylase family protein [Cupriavidus taiwanensis]|uniref:Carboxymuconolactone decarboxylase-like domain-containing protein n=2 Tax=Cupriavidus taiwanensis TaxID=164546 RepID=A0A375HF70_9BURK|nr:carboxymuconolactone decarboxylase family protein [Cupriavidus taiwanensis]SOY69332.1 acetoin catabolism operon, putative enzyme involved in degradation of aromatic compounds [Cupriavidus taiwanensis]SOY70027.1 acetoin catabolism operon, putative enzyme involved in degradation of aromatic compounds [Cupriavidus taiwanensis]SOY92352.1 acetoin catabolism operon, putative enzyme involved in degradation of aromatic compounds [Cupriavidus taiwanensis]SOZ29508.1 acetoin catabolism operon, putative